MSIFPKRDYSKTRVTNWHSRDETWLQKSFRVLMAVVFTHKLVKSHTNPGFKFLLRILAFRSGTIWQWLTGAHKHLLHVHFSLSLSFTSTPYRFPCISRSRYRSHVAGKESLLPGTSHNVNSTKGSVYSTENNFSNSSTSE